MHKRDVAPLKLLLWRKEGWVACMRPHPVSASKSSTSSYSFPDFLEKSIKNYDFIGLFLSLSFFFVSLRLWIGCMSELNFLLLVYLFNGLQWKKKKRKKVYLTLTRSLFFGFDAPTTNVEKWESWITKRLTIYFLLRVVHIMTSRKFGQFLTPCYY